MTASSHSSAIAQILDLARWAPSGDNTQPWQFELIDESRLVVHGFDTREHCVYDLDGHPSQISLGALLETMAIAASGLGLRMNARRRRDCEDARPMIDVRFVDDAALAADPLIDSITKRSVQRRPMRVRRLTARERAALEHSVGSAHRLLWLEDLCSRWKATHLIFRYAKLRLTMPEAYRVHREIIQWNARYSEDRVPDQALGIDPLTVHLMRFVMRSWRRVRFFNAFLAGTWMPRIQMELIPGLACAAHFLVVANKQPESIDDYIDAGRAVQRFWLTATHLGLVMQPELTPLIFSRYVRNSVRFCADPRTQRYARALSNQLDTLAGAEAAATSVFMGRVGAGSTPHARSTRRSLDELIVGRQQREDSAADRTRD
jgi:hypothetical protein